MRPAMVEDVRAAVEEHVLPWFARNRRDLPWRARRSAYRVLVSEFMLQQTRVDQAIERYRLFMRRFPSLRALAAAERDDVLKAWEGLGYYARARNLHALARGVVDRHRGRFPRTIEGLRSLPGVGSYTAAAVGSMAMGLDAAVVDGNVRRVLCRVFGMRKAPAAASRRLESLAERLLLPGQAGVCNEAWMELGALVCTPRSPRCTACPFSGLCRAARSGRPEQFPARIRGKAVPHLEVGAALVRDGRGRILIAQRRASDMLGGLWEFPGGKRESGETMQACIERELLEELNIRVRVGERLTVVRHAYSHFTMDLHAYWARKTGGRTACLQCDDFAWVVPDAFDVYAFSRADLKIIERLRGNGAGARVIPRKGPAAPRPPRPSRSRPPRSVPSRA